MVIGLLGILKAGGAYVPLDPNFPRERLQYMLRDSDPAAVLGHAKTRGLLSELLAGRESLLIDLQEVSRSQDGRDENLPRHSLGLTSRHLAYIIHTSGSTGQPKGVMVEHRGVVNFLGSMQRQFEMTAADRLLSVTTLSFDIAGLEIYLPLISGARLIVANKAVTADADALAREIEKAEVTVLQATPATWRLLVSGGWEGKKDLKALCGGEALSEHQSRQIESRVAGLWNLYGPTETTIWSSSRRIEGAREAGEAIESIGRPIWNTQIYILDPHRQPVPLGAAGEIYIGGAGVARGYLNREDLTAERFLRDPFSADPDARMYRTGDLGRWRSDGNIEYLGRNDSQVKIRGFRIELGEIEARLQEYAGLREAVVVAREDQAGDKRLVAYYVANEGDASLSVSELRAHLQQILPEYMVPAAYVQLEQLPLTPNGKLDRKALPAPEGDAYVRREYEAPQGQVEEGIARIWQELLRVDRVSRLDNFFELGGHSLLVIQLVSRVRARFNVELPLQVVFDEGSLQAIAAVIAQAQPARLPAIEAADRSQPLPLSFAQQRLWFMSQMEGMNRSYNIPSGFELRGTLNRLALRAALDRVVARHEALRTTFRSVGGNAAQIIADPHAKFALTEHDLSGAPHPHEEIQRLSAEEAGAVFDLQNGPLIRGRLLRLSDDEHVLLITIHHIIFDGRSMAVLLGELSALYDAFNNGSPDPLPPLTTQYADFAAWQRKWLTKDIRDRQLDYWRGKLADAVPVDLPTDFPRPPERTHRGGLCTFQVGEKTSKKLHSLMRADGATLHMFMLAVFQVLLSRISAQRDITIAIAASGRIHEGFEKLIGLFVNSLLIRVDVNPGSTFREHLAQVKRTAVEAYENRDVPFEQTIAMMRSDLGVSGSVALIEMNVDVTKQQGLRPSTLTSLTSSQVSAKGDLMLEGHGGEQGLNLSLIYPVDLFKEATVSAFGRQLTRILEQIADEPGVSISTLLSADEAERRRVLIDWNDTAVSYPHDRCIHELFEDQVAKAPDAVAVASDEPPLTYGELNRRSNRLARYLRARGVTPDSRVALCMVRGQEMVIAILAVLKAGGSYVPLDPGYPRERLAYILEDAGTALVLTQQRLRQVLPEQGGAVITLEEVWDSVEKESPENLSRAETGLAPNHLAYVIYTSGSTGQPKGVMVEHRSVVNHNWHMRRSFSLTSEDCVLQFASYSFDASVEEFFPTMMAGARLLVRGTEVPTPDELCSQVRLHGVSVLNFPTAYWHAWSAGIEAHLQALGSLRLVVLGGEKVSAEAVRHWNRVAPRRCRLLNTYGPTEATISCTSFEIQQAATATSEIPIGRPISNTRIYILNERREPTPVGVAGEIYIGGAGVARGYLNRPDLTAERFLKDPFDQDQHARIYRTGDLGRWLADGNVEYLGRNDSQVKIRGFRIELGEIEARLLQYSGIRQAVVVAREDRPGDRRLVAYLVSDSPGVRTSLGDLRIHMQSTLPEYMVPAAYVYLDCMPLTPNGKLDRRALPVPENAAFHHLDDESPQGEAEEVIAQIWQELLDLERVGRNDNFFDLGGHSLLALQARDRINERLSVEIPLTALFRAPTLAKLAAKAADYRTSKFKKLVDATIDVSHDDLVKHVETMSEEQIDQLMKEIE
jgi:amino acid adenylation domain-containing protein